MPRSQAPTPALVTSGCPVVLTVVLHAVLARPCSWSSSWLRLARLVMLVLVERRRPAHGCALTSVAVIAAMTRR